MKKILLLFVLIISLSSCGMLRLSIPEPSYLWPDNTVIYSIDENISDSSLKIIEEAVEIWQSKTNINFILVDRTSLSYHIKFDKNINFSACSTLGFNNYNYMKIRYISLIAVLHELGHCIGLEHEHQRMDRDNYIDIVWENIDVNLKNGYVKKQSKIKKLNEIYDNKPYDYESIMHYSAILNGKVFIKSDVLIKRSGITDLDIYTVNKLYE